MSERNLVILYGSQTGTAADVSKRIRKLAKQWHFKTSFMAMNDFPIEKLASTTLIVFVCSTTGQGEEPDNMKTFWRNLLRRRLPPNSLTHLEFSVLGLGDSSYQYFNFPAKRLHKRLLRLGATAFHELGLGDDQHDLGFDGVANPWIGSLFEILLEKFPLPKGITKLEDDGPPEPSYTVEVLDSLPNVSEIAQINSSPYDADQPFPAVLISNERVTAEDHFQDVRFLKFDTKGSGIVYEPGDVLMVCPTNHGEQVSQLLSLLNLDGETVLQLKSNDEDIRLPSAARLTNPCTIFQAATRYWDFQGVPRRSFFELLAHFAHDPREKERLKEFASPQGTDELFDYCFRPKRTCSEVLQDFGDTRARVPVEFWFDLFQPIQPRPFSIASSMKFHRDEIHILVAVVTYKTKLKRQRVGLCSNWLASLQAGDTVRIWTKKGSMKFDKVDSRPVVMVGPGTGVAPFRSFIYDRVAIEENDSILFFGCRSRHLDFYFEKEWTKLQEDGLLNLMRPAFSRDQPEKVYVQHRMEAAGHLVFDSVFSQDGYFYVAGNSKNMPTEVMFALQKIISDNGKMGLEEAEIYIKRMQKEGRYQTETWS